jgi:hypothetical protein
MKRWFVYTYIPTNYFRPTQNNTIWDVSTKKNCLQINFLSENGNIFQLFFSIFDISSHIPYISSSFWLIEVAMAICET